MTKKGFTLVELMVTITIMMIMTSIVIFNYNKFNENSLLSQFAYDLSLTIRQAQVYGVATRESGVNQSAQITVGSVSNSSVNNFNNAYGVHFDSNSSATNPFLLFIDSVKDGKYTSDDIVLQPYTFQRGIKIWKLCKVTSSSAAEECIDSTPPKTLDITFTRPDPEAIFSYNGVLDSSISAAKIYLSSSDNKLPRTVVVYSTGQISVQ